MRSRCHLFGLNEADFSASLGEKKTVLVGLWSSPIESVKETIQQTMTTKKYIFGGSVAVKGNRFASAAFR